jgi:hypothetical protein
MTYNFVLLLMYINACVCVCRSSMSLSCLATVELQLVMHHLDLPSLLALARCCRTTLAAASCDFACKYLTVDILACIYGMRPDPRASRVLRHCDVAVAWMCTTSCTIGCVCSGSEVGMTMLTSLARVSSFAGTYTPVLLGPWIERRSYAQYARDCIQQGFNTFRTTGFPVAILRSIGCASMRVTTLSLRGGIGINNATFYAPLTRMHRLATLFVTRPGASLTDEILDSCVNLRSLSLVSPHADTIQSLLTSTCAQRLEKIYLSGDKYRIYWIDALRNMRALHTLTLALQESLDDVLRALRIEGTAPMLRVLGVHAYMCHTNMGSVNLTRFITERPTVTLVFSAMESMQPIIQTLQERFPNRVVSRKTPCSQW